MNDIWNLDKLLIITDTTDDDRLWLTGIACVTSDYQLCHVYMGNPCIPIFPDEKQYTLVLLKYGDKVQQVDVTSREIGEIYNHFFYTPYGLFGK